MNDCQGQPMITKGKQSSSTPLCTPPHSPPCSYTPLCVPLHFSALPSRFPSTLPCTLSCPYMLLPPHLPMCPSALLCDPLCAAFCASPYSSCTPLHSHPQSLPCSYALIHNSLHTPSHSSMLPSMLLCTKFYITSCPPHSPLHPIRLLVFNDLIYIKSYFSPTTS